ncbi:MAG: hypothetical protein OQK58_03495 [Gammaproteobacteria bacterium]|nr:hypothetical protein [Gammaproteobacteria bacterium]
MIKLTNVIKKWDTPGFKDYLKSELQNINPSALPLQQGLSLSSYVGQTPFSVVILNIKEQDNHIVVKTGIFYTGIIAGCSCSDDPSPVDEQNEYCELQFTINKNTAETEVSLLND